MIGMSEILDWGVEVVNLNDEMILRIRTTHHT